MQHIIDGIFILLGFNYMCIVYALECECVPLKECAPYMRLLRSNNTPKTRKEIISSICESISNELKICCPNHAFAENYFFPVNCGTSRIGHKISGGIITHIGEFPWMVALGYKTKTVSNKIDFQCAGSIINSRYVVTAAHCVHSNFTKGFKLSKARLGEWNFSSTLDCIPADRFFDKMCAPPTVDLDIEEYFIHPNFNRRKKLSDDIAVIRLSKSINFDESEGFLEPICFPSLGLSPEFETNEDNVSAAGWGLTENRTFSEIMLKVNLPFADIEHCRNVYRSRFTDFQLCVGGQAGKDTCMGDSGGPLMLTELGHKFILIGIVSYGEDSCSGQLPAVYSSVSDYRDWIESVMRQW